MTDGRVKITLENGIAIVFSDSHYWPNLKTTAHRALCWLCGDLRPDLVIANGDILDGARISKHTRIGWEKAPKLKDELETCQQRLAEVVAACVGEPEFVWTLGNHDARFETALANMVPAFSGVQGTQLRDHFPRFWQPCWCCVINDDVVIKHRWKGGAQATRSNTIQSGVSIVTGHLHSLRVTPYSDYRGTRYGVDCGTLADPYGPQFQAYTEDSPVDWRSGFVVLTFKDGKLLWPEVCAVEGRPEDGVVSFRGKLIGV